MFQFPEFPPHTLSIRVWVTVLLTAGFPHSDIKGSMPACGSPLLFAACHVLLRRLVPWHPPCALVRLITSILRLVTLFRSFLTFYSQLVFQTSFLVFLLVQLSRCVGALAPFRLPSGILKTIQTIGQQLTLFLRPSGLSLQRFRFRFRAIDLGLKRCSFELSCSLERR